MILGYMNAYAEKLLNEIYKGSVGVSDEERKTMIKKRFEEERQEFENVALGAFLDEVMQHGHNIESDVIQEGQAINDAIRICAKACAEYYGMVEYQEFAQMVAEYSGFDNIPFEATLKVLRVLAPPCLHGFTLTTFNDDLYICHPMLSLESNEFGYDEDVREALLDYQTYLIQRHAQMSQCPIKQIMDQGPIVDYAIELDSAKALRKWIDTHLPDGEDLTFADIFLKAIVEITRGPIDPYDIPILMGDYGLDEYEKGETYELLMLIMTFMNDVPIWENNGYSHKEATYQG